MTRRRVIPATLALGAVAVLTLPGCARARERWDARFNPPPPEPARIITPDSAAVSPAEVGLEVVVWTADDTYFRVGRALNRIGRPEPSLPEAEREAWKRAGLRVLAVPVGQLDELLNAAPPLTPVQRQRYAQLPSWTPIVRGPGLPHGVRNPDGGSIDPGNPRLIVRSWVEPGVTDEGPADRLRTELAIQIERQYRPALLTDPLAARSIIASGEVIESLLTALHGDGRTAAVIVAEQPEIDWNRLPDIPPPPQRGVGANGEGPRADEDPRERAQGPDEQSPDGPAPADPVGPGAPRDRSVGEWMLSSPGTPARDGRRPVGPRKVILVLIPRLQAAPPPPDLGGGAS